MEWFDANYVKFKNAINSAVPHAVNTYTQQYIRKLSKHPSLQTERRKVQSLKTAQQRFEYLSHKNLATRLTGRSIETFINTAVQAETKRKLGKMNFDYTIGAAKLILKDNGRYDSKRIGQAAHVVQHLSPNDKSLIQAAHRDIKVREIYAPEAGKIDRHLVSIMKMTPNSTARKKKVGVLIRRLNEGFSNANPASRKEREQWRNVMSSLQSILESVALRGTVTTLRLSTLVGNLGRSDTVQAWENSANTWARGLHKVFNPDVAARVGRVLIAAAAPLVFASLTLNFVTGNWKTGKGIGRTFGDVFYTIGLMPLTAKNFPGASNTVARAAARMIAGLGSTITGAMRDAAAAGADMAADVMNIAAEAGVRTVAEVNGVTRAEAAFAEAQIARRAGQDAAERLVTRLGNQATASKFFLGLGDIAVGIGVLYAGAQDQKAGHINRGRANFVAGAASVAAGVFIIAGLAGAAAPISGYLLATVVVLTAVSWGAGIAAAFIKD